MSVNYKINVNDRTFEVVDKRREYFNKSSKAFQKSIKNSYIGYLKIQDLETVFKNILTSEYFNNHFDDIANLEITFAANRGIELAVNYEKGKGTFGIFDRKRMANLIDFDCFVYPAICRSISNEHEVKEQIKFDYIKMMINRFANYGDAVEEYYKSLKEDGITNYKKVIRFIQQSKETNKTD